jgi:hypothetical protein
MLPVTAHHPAILIVSTAAKEVILPGTAKNRENKWTVVVGQGPDPPEVARTSNATTATVLGTLPGTATDQSNVALGILDPAPQGGLLLAIVATSKATLLETVQTKENVTTDVAVVTGPAPEADPHLQAILAGGPKTAGAEETEAPAPDPAGRPTEETRPAPEATAPAKTGMAPRKTGSPVKRARPAPLPPAPEAPPRPGPGPDSTKKTKNVQRQDPARLTPALAANFPQEAGATKAAPNPPSPKTSLLPVSPKEARGPRVKGQNLRRSLPNLK